MQTNRPNGGPSLLGVILGGGTLAGLTEIELLRRYIDGGDADGELAFESLVRLHGPMVMRVCRSILADHHDAQDAFQATFLILARRAGSIRKVCSLAPWLHGVALRVSRAARAEAARRRAHELRAASLVLASVEELPDQEMTALVHEGLGRLPVRYRTPMILCDLEGLTHDAAAARLGWKVGTVKSRLSRGRQRLRGYLTRRGLAPEGQSSALLLAAGLGARSPIAAASSYATASIFRSPTSAEVSVRVAVLMRKAIRDMAIPKLAILSGLILAGGLATRGTMHAGPWPQIEAPTASSPAEASRSDGPGQVAQHVGAVRPELAIKLTGHDVLHSGQSDEYRISIANTGKAAASDVNIRISLPREGGRLVKINDTSMVFLKQSRELSWRLSRLEPGRSSETSFVYLMSGPGLYRATVEATSGDVRAVASHQTEVSGNARLEVDAFPSARTIGIGETTSYHITVTNVGGRDVARVILRGKLSKNLKITRHRGAGEDIFRLNPETGEFILAQIDRLPIGQDVRLGLDLQGVEAGPGSCRLSILPVFESDDEARAEAEILTKVERGKSSKE